MQLADTLKQELSDQTAKTRQMLVTAGGALNPFLMTRLREVIKERCLDVEVHECDEETIQFKECLLLSFLGLRTLLGLPNISNFVTGARCESVSGGIHLPPITEPLNTPRMEQYSFHFRRSSHSHDVLPGFGFGGWNPVGLGGPSEPLGSPQQRKKRMSLPALHRQSSAPQAGPY